MGTIPAGKENSKLYGMHDPRAAGGPLDRATVRGCGSPSQPGFSYSPSRERLELH